MKTFFPKWSFAELCCVECSTWPSYTSLPSTSGMNGLLPPKPIANTTWRTCRTRVEPSARSTVTSHSLFASCVALVTVEDVQTFSSSASA